MTAILPKASTPLVLANGLMAPEWYRLFQTAFGDVNALTALSGADTDAGTMPGNVTGSPAPDARLTATQVKAFLAIAQSDVSGLTSALAGKASLSQTWEQSWTFIAPTDGDIRMVVDAKKARSITSVTTRCASGSITLTVKINTTALGGSANAISTSEQTQSHGSANAIAAGDDVVFTFSSNAACTYATVTLGGTLTLA